MESAVIIREYRPEDLEACRALWKELTDWHRQIYEDQTIGGEHPEDQYDQHLTAVEPGQLWVAQLGSRVVGLVGLILKRNEAEVEPIIVGKEQRGTGIGNNCWRERFLRPA